MSSFEEEGVESICKHSRSYITLLQVSAYAIANAEPAA